ncbi:hypothetical protein SAMN04487995_5946 [Dyadobacter koreensis]|uniref:Uncharacterized protein n=1 Tax=Dyadobacter koreensis TaxID=408657 RepID=A0A1H7ATY5_9BACT|nr:hypothetical protein [Dyadobacter koreensis]SEJ69039.1 hypothetical protein SAMN04487995_5946 [Dyadobacter koreensis]
MKSIFKKSIIAAAFLFGAVGISNAQVKVGNNPTFINPSAALEIETTNKGFLPPRIALTSTTDITTIPSPAVGLLVYNTANAGTGATKVTANTMYTWNGQSWAAIQATLGGSKALAYAVAKSSPISANTVNETTVCLGDLCVRYLPTSATGGQLQIKVSTAGGSFVGYTTLIYGGGGCNPCTVYNNNLQAAQDTWVTTSAGANADLRDFANGNIALYNSQKLYRYSLVANGNMPANGGIFAAASAVSVFLEEIQ